MLFLGVYLTMMLNVSDYSRELQHKMGSGRQVAIYANSILPATLFMGLIELMMSSATGEVDPILVFASAVDNKILLVVTLLFIAFAQVTTNILNNVVPPAYAMMDVFKLSFRTAAVIVGRLAFATFPGCWCATSPRRAWGCSFKPKARFWGRFSRSWLSITMSSVVKA